MMNRVLSILLPLGVTVCAMAAPPDSTIINTDEVPWDVGPEEGITLKRFTGALARLNLVRWGRGHDYGAAYSRDRADSVGAVWELPNYGGGPSEPARGG